MAGETAHAAESSGFPPFDQLGDFGVSQVFWLAVTFAILYFALSNVLLPKIRKALEDRNSTIFTNVAEADLLNKKADEAVSAFEADITRARASARDTAAKAKAKVDAEIAAETAKVEADLNRRLTDAEARIAEVRAAAMRNVAGVASDTAGAIVEKLTGRTADPALLSRAVAAAGRS